MRKSTRMFTILGLMLTLASIAPASADAQTSGTRHVAISYDHIPNIQGGRPTGIAVFGEQQTVMNHLTIVVGTSFHRISGTGTYGGTQGAASASQLFAGGGPGIRYQAADDITISEIPSFWHMK